MLNGMKTDRLISIAGQILFVLYLSQTGCGQTSTLHLDKAQALRDVKVKSVGGWKEAISDKGRFRILFPGEPATRESGQPVGSSLGEALLFITGQICYVGTKRALPAGHPRSQQEAAQLS
jgi:hypothetical protein